MISAGDFRNGITIELDNNIYQIIEFQHVKPGKGAAFVRTKLKNVKSGGVIEKTFRPTEKCPQARIDRKDMQYLYSDGDLFNFMDMENYEQMALAPDVIGDALKFVKENETVKVCSYNGKVFSVEPPLFVELEITNTEPGFKGDTAPVPENICPEHKAVTFKMKAEARPLKSLAFAVKAAEAERNI